MPYHRIRTTPPDREAARQMILSRTSPSVLPEDPDYGQLRRILSAQIHGDIRESDLFDVIDLQDQLYDVGTGSHPDQRTNRSGTIDNTADLQDQIEDNLNANVNTLLDYAGVK